MAGIYKAYDIRGIVGEELTEDTAYSIGRAFVTFLKCKKVAVGRDMRPHSDTLFEALSRGITEQGADVIDLGLCSTPMNYYANGKLGCDAGIMLTASHNPGEYNGFKLCREQAIPISGVSGIGDIERIVTEGSYADKAPEPGQVTSYDIIPEYIEHIRSFANIKKPVKVCIDFANAMGLYENKVLEGLVEIDPLFDTLDGSFPNHEANPLVDETYESLQEKVRQGEYDFGLYYDGDADRAGFTDEKGNIIRMDMITALIAREILKQEKGTVFYDLRSSWATKEVIEENGGEPKMSRVGHAFIKQQMREAGAVFAGELSGHYYFRENYYAESSSLAALFIANLVSASDQPLSEIVAPLQRYVASGEINSRVEDTEQVFVRLKEKFPEERMFALDGLSCEFDDWWFNVRSSNTEPLIRLNLEARTPELMEKKRDELLALINA